MTPSNRQLDVLTLIQWQLEIIALAKCLLCDSFVNCPLSSCIMGVLSMCRVFSFFHCDCLSFCIVSYLLRNLRSCFHYNKLCLFQTIQISLQDIRCIKMCDDHCIAMYTTDPHNVDHPFLLKTQSEAEAREWVIFFFYT